MSDAPYGLYNPAMLPADVLLREFTARRPLLENLLEIVRGNAPDEPLQHCLLIGARGMGKTTTLWAIAHKVTADSELSAAWQPVVFDEESRRVGDLADFWLEALRQWEHATGIPGDRSGQLLDENPTDIEVRARDTFLSLVNDSKKRALLLIDNINDLLSAIRDKAELHRLRAFLMADSRVMIIGGATRFFQEITSVDQPFYDFFRVFELDKLSLVEMRECLSAMAEHREDTEVHKALEERSGTIGALHLLTGGNPRLIKTFYRLIKEGLHSDVRADLERLLDEFTPYFKAIVDALPVQQQRVLDAVALAWDPVDAGSVAKVTRLPSNQASAQLRALVKSGLLIEGSGNPKRKSYLLADRFSNIHYLMRHGRAARSRFEWFVSMVRLVFSPKKADEVLMRTACDAALAGEDGKRDARAIAYSSIQRTEDGESREKWLRSMVSGACSPATLKAIEDLCRSVADEKSVKGKLREFVDVLPTELREIIGYFPNESRWWLRFSSLFWIQKAWLFAKAACEVAIELDPEDAVPWNDLGILLTYHFARHEEAEAAYRQSIELDTAYAVPWRNLGSLLTGHFERHEEAEVAYRKSIELDPVLPYPWSGLADVLFRRIEGLFEAKESAIKGLSLKPDCGFAQYVFSKICGDDITCWHQVLPDLSDWCATHKEDRDVLELTTDGYLRLARLSSSTKALELLDSLDADSCAPFETLRDALVACESRDHLHKLAPERRAVAIMMMKRINEEPEDAEVESS